MAVRTYVCTDWDADTATCHAAEWVVHPLIEILPTVEQAHSVGGLMFIGVMSVLAMGLLIPRSNDDE